MEKYSVKIELVRKYMENPYYLVCDCNGSNVRAFSFMDNPKEECDIKIWNESKALAEAKEYARFVLENKGAELRTVIEVLE